MGLKELQLDEHAFRITRATELGLTALTRTLLFRQYLHSSLQPVPETVLTAYRNYAPEIADVYGEHHLKNEYLFHGTGRYHYDTNGRNKYDMQANGHTLDILQTILTSGLQPQQDIWMPTPMSAPTVSLARQRFYARWYADRHNVEPLQWSYGNSADWAFMYVIKTIGSAVALPYIALLLRTQSKRKSGLLGSAHQWVSDVRNDVVPRTDYSVVWKGKSTIPHNFGAVISMKDDDVWSYDLHLLHRSEKRTMQAITPDTFQTIEVPLTYVPEVKTVVQNVGYSHVHVLPTECVDLHMQTFPLEELTSMQSDRKPAIPNTIELSDVQHLSFYPLTREQVCTATTSTDTTPYFPEKLLKTLDEAPIVRTLLSQQCNWEGYSLRYHTLCGLLLFDTYCRSPQMLPAGVTREFMRLFYSLHDIGDSLGHTTTEKLQYNQAIATSFFSQLGFSEQEILLVRALLSDDPVGTYLKKAGVLSKAFSKMPSHVSQMFQKKIQVKIDALAREAKLSIQKMAQIAHMEYHDFLQVLTTYHMIDAGSYTSRAGSIGTLNYVFEFDDHSQQMRYAKEIQLLMQELQS